MGKCYTYQKPILTIDAPVHVRMYTGAKMGRTGVKWHPQGEDLTYQSDEIYVCPLCVGGLPIEESSNGDGRLLEVEGRDVLQDLIPLCGVAGISPGFC